MYSERLKELTYVDLDTVFFINTYEYSSSSDMMVVYLICKRKIFVDGSPFCNKFKKKTCL